MDLESDWMAAAEKKKTRDQEEVAFRATPAGLTLLEQSDPYDRCGR